MSLPVDLPPPRRPLFLPVVIATVFLSIIGMSAGFALGTRHESSPAATPVNLPGQDGTVSLPTPGSAACPPEMHRTARTLGITADLTELLKVRATDTGMVVWICQDPGGMLYYQANQGGEDGRWIEGQTALFLADVTGDDGTYTATAKDGNTFRVNKRQLWVRTRKGEETHEVVPVG